MDANTYVVGGYRSTHGTAVRSATCVRYRSRARHEPGIRSKL